MYVPSSFKEERVEVLHEVLRLHDFGLLVTQGPNGVSATHLPLLLDTRRGANGVLLGHLARANEQWRQLEDGECLAVFSGPHAYISPSWYEGTDNVPTWNYVAVHACGRARLVEGDELRELLARMVERHEGPRPRPWSLEAVSARYMESMLQGIVGFELEIARLVGQLKLSQNRTERDRRSVIQGLREQGRPDELATAAWMQKGR